MSSTERTPGTSIVLLVLAAVVAVIGFVNAAEGPTCGRDAMSPGDTCWIDGVRSSYADRVAASRTAPLVNGLIALVLVGCAVGCWPRGDRGKTRQAANGAVGGRARGGGARYGDGTPSELIDPGVWLAVADRYARRTPGDGTGLDAATRRAARKDIAWAAAAVDEVLAFIPRGGTAVPAAAFTSEAGRRIRDREPGRFGRARLEAVRDTYRQIAAELADPQPDRAT
jgi:hypothetical protein